MKKVLLVLVFLVAFDSSMILAQEAKDDAKEDRVCSHRLRLTTEVAEEDGEDSFSIIIPKESEMRVYKKKGEIEIYIYFKCNQQ